MRFLKILFIAAVMCSLSACFMAKEKPYIEVVEGWFYTPDGKYEVELVSEFKGSASWRISTGGDKYIAPDVYLAGIGGEVEFLFGALKHYNRVMIDYIVREDGASFTAAQLQVQYESKGKRERILIQDNEEKPHKAYKTVEGERMWRENFQMFFTPPHALARYSTVLRGGGLTKSQLAVYEKYEDEPHRIIIPFKIGEDEYKFDVTFKVTTKTDWVGGVPGM
ncbi:hypothetical protein GP5015_730 [gamma proteobacterium HTCC5015]|nr:hypothetical protein GP5015_730 [gamma proteobacterium HTCC5015]